MSARVTLAAAALALCAACQSGPTIPETLAVARVSPDFDSYELNRIGLIPFAEAGSDADASAEFVAGAFYMELSQSTPYEIVLLDPIDLAETTESEPHRRGWYNPRTIIELARRFRLDGLFVGTVTQHKSYPPQQLSVGMELVSAETGSVLWTSQVHLDAADRRVRDSLAAYVESERGETSAQLALLSPSSFARFAAWQMARLL